MPSRSSSILCTGAAVLLASTSLAGAADYTLRIQTHHPGESLPGKIFLQMVDDIETMSNGRLEIEEYTASAVVKSVETFDAASTGILDCDMTGAAYQTGKDAGFQFLGDVMGGYDTPVQLLAFLDYGGGREIADELYGEYNMHLVGWWLQSQESLSSTKPIANASDLKDWKFRSPPGMETEIFSKLGAKPIVMDFGEVFTAMNTGIVDGADYSALNANKSVGLYDIAKFATFPGFHSMPADHLACNQDVWDELPEDLKRIIEVALKKAAHDIMLQAEVLNQETARELEAAGVTIQDWSTEDRKEYRRFAQEVWQDWAEKSESAGKLVPAHIEFMKKLGLAD